MTKPDPKSSPPDYYALAQMSVHYGPIHFTPDKATHERKALLKPLADGITVVRSLTLNLLFFLLLLLLGALIWDEIHRSHVTIEPIYIPGPLKDRGYSEQIAAFRLRDAINVIQEVATTEKERLSFVPDSNGIEIVIPELGISLKSFVQFLRKFLNLSTTTVSGEFMCVTFPCTMESVALRLRISDVGTETVDLEMFGSSKETSYFEEAAKKILLQIDPYIVASFYSESNPEEAALIANKMIGERHRNMEWARNLLGLIAFRKEDYVEAKRLYELAIKDNPQFYGAYHNLGRVLGRLGEQDRAVSALRRSIELNPTFAPSHNELGARLAELGDNDGATAAFQRAIEIDPDDPLTHNNLGIFLKTMDDVEGAVEEYRLAIEIDPNYADAHYNLGISLLAVGNVDGAIEAYRRAIEIQPNYALAHNNLGVALSNVGNVDGAIEEYRRAIEIQPKYALAHNNPSQEKPAC